MLQVVIVRPPIESDVGPMDGADMERRSLTMGDNGHLKSVFDLFEGPEKRLGIIPAANAYFHVGHGAFS